jgi:hypothetical protein
MQKTKKVRLVFSELQCIYGEEMEAHELLELASLMVRASEDSIIDIKFGFQRGPTLFSELPVCDVMERFGWRIVEQDYRESEDDFMPFVSEQFLLDEVMSTAV